MQRLTRFFKVGAVTTLSYICIVRLPLNLVFFVGLKEGKKQSEKKNIFLDRHVNVWHLKSGANATTTNSC